MRDNRVETTLFMLTSVDGKISTGDNNDRDVDKDFPKINIVKDGLFQYYDLEQRTDLFSLNSGRVMDKIGINEKSDEVEKTPVTFVIIDNKPHLNLSGIKYLLKRSQKLIVVTSNSGHPAFDVKDAYDLEVIFYDGGEIDFKDLFVRLRRDFKAERVTIQSGGTLNAVLLRGGLIDHISIVVAPVLVGGEYTPTLIDGESLHTEEDLVKIKPLNLVKCDILNHSYLHLQYDVIN